MRRGNQFVIPVFNNKAKVNARAFAIEEAFVALDQGRSLVVTEDVRIVKEELVANVEENAKSQELTLDFVKELIAMGADVHFKNDYALQMAARQGRLDVVVFLVEEMGCDPNVKNRYPERLAADKGNVEVVKYFESLKEEK